MGGKEVFVTIADGEAARILMESQKQSMVEEQLLLADDLERQLLLER